MGGDEEAVYTTDEFAPPDQASELGRDYYYVEDD